MQLPWHEHRQGATWAMVPKIYHFHKLPLILVVLRLSEHMVMSRNYNAMHNKKAYRTMLVLPKVLSP